MGFGLSVNSQGVDWASTLPIHRLSSIDQLSFISTPCPIRYSLLGFTHPLVWVFLFAHLSFYSSLGLHTWLLLRFTHLSLFWVYAPISFYLGLRTHHLIGVYAPVLFIWVYAPVPFYLGLRTRHLIGVYAPVIYLGLSTHYFMWVYAPVIYLGLSTRYFMWVYTPVNFPWVYAPFFSFVWVYAPLISSV
jgi:hypothetical protein